MCLKALKCRKWTFLGYSISPPFDSSIISIICCSQRLRMNFHAQILTKLDLISDWSHSIEPEAGLLVWNMLTGKNSCKLHVGPQCCDYLLMLFRFTHTQSLGMHSHALPHPGGCTQWVCSTPAMTTTWYNSTSSSSSHDLPRPIRQQGHREYGVSQVLCHQSSPASKSIGGEQEGHLLLGWEAAIWFTVHSGDVV